VVKNGTPYLISLQDKDFSREQLFRQIISTFKFTDSSAVNSSVDTSTWKTYKGKNFEFKYPSNGKVETDQLSLVYISANIQPYYTFTINVENNPSKLTTTQAVNKIISDIRNNKNAPWATSQADQMTKTLKDYTNGQINGIKLQSFDEGYPGAFGDVIQATENNIYKFHIGNGSGGGVSKNDEMRLDQILQTFKFTQ
jgi:hypothetical protein